jgi:NADPH-dependent curcumin reductase
MSSETTNRQVRLAKRPAAGLVTRDVFSIEDVPIPQPGPGEFREKLSYISLDPAMRGWINEGRSYIRPVGLGEAMRGYAVGVVEKSNTPDF